MPAGYDEWFKRWGDDVRLFPPFWDLIQPILDWLVEISADGPVAYVECRCEGGPCAQIAGVWHRGELVLGPIIDPTDPASVGADGAINAALRYLGVETIWAIDEFDAVGLPTNRATEDWFENKVHDPPPDAWRSVRDRVVPAWEPITFTFLPGAAVAVGNRDSKSSAAARYLVRPVRLSVGGQELMGSSHDPWRPLSIVLLAVGGLACLRWALNGATCFVPLAKNLKLGLRVSIYYGHHAVDA